MTVIGQKPPPYFHEGRQQCEARLLETVAKLQALAGEAEGTFERALYENHLYWIGKRLEWMEGLKLKWEGQER